MKGREDKGVEERRVGYIGEELRSKEEKRAEQNKEEDCSTKQHYCSKDHILI